MSRYFFPAALGLLLGLTLRWTQLCHPDALRAALAWRISHALRSLLYLLGASLALTALLMWLAVIDVDRIDVLPVSAGAIAGGAVFGAAAALAGYTPLTAFAGVGGASPLPALCTLAGCLGGTLLLPLLEAPLATLRSLPPYSAATVFRTTLDEPYLLGGGFLSQGCAGALLISIAICIPSNRFAAQPQAEPSPAGAAEDAMEPDAISGPLLLPAPQESTQSDDPAPTQDAPQAAFIALLPGEEPLVVDTAPDMETPQSSDDDAAPPAE